MIPGAGAAEGGWGGASGEEEGRKKVGEVVNAEASRQVKKCGRAKLVLDHPKVEEVVTREDLVLLSVATLPVNVVARAVYAAGVREAEKRIGHRDPDDADLLALALHLGVPVWSNDNDFEDDGAKWYTTAGLLKKLGA
jgi:predicted nucleic acid-binding protein